MQGRSKEFLENSSKEPGIHQSEHEQSTCSTPRRAESGIWISELEQVGDTSRDVESASSDEVNLRFCLAAGNARARILQFTSTCILLSTR